MAPDTSALILLLLIEHARAEKSDLFGSSGGISSNRRKRSVGIRLKTSRESCSLALSLELHGFLYCLAKSDDHLLVATDLV